MITAYLGTKVWVTQNGISLTAKQMEDKHLYNLIMYLQKPRFLDILRSRLVAYAYCLPIGYPAGDMACECFEREIQAIELMQNDDLFRQYVRRSVLWRSLISEADKRGIRHNLMKRV